MRHKVCKILSPVLGTQRVLQKSVPESSCRLESPLHVLKSSRYRGGKKPSQNFNPQLFSLKDYYISRDVIKFSPRSQITFIANNFS